MLTFSAYAVRPAGLLQDYDRILASFRRQGITRAALAVSMTGKLMSTLDDMRAAKDRLERDGMEVFGLIYGIGHPAMQRFYDAEGHPPSPLPFFDGDGPVDGFGGDGALLPRGWQYAVNEFGNPVFCCACPNQACIDGNQRIVRQIAGIFDEIWYDDDYRTDGDQWAGTPSRSSASCYCDACLADLSQRVGRTVRREDVIGDENLHEKWVELKTDRLAGLWKGICEAARETNPRVKMGLMIRWNGEERDGIDLAKILVATGQNVSPYPSAPLRLRAGEGHFGAREYAKPASQVEEYLAASYHAGWFPKDSLVLSETTYFQGMRREDILKKVALALAAGVSEISYCCCVPGWVRYQDFLEPDVPMMIRWAEELAPPARLHQPAAILRSPAAARGDCRPGQRMRDRPCFPLLSMAGLSSAVYRWRPGDALPESDVIAVTGRTVLDVGPDALAGRHVVVDGHALLEDSPLQAWLGIHQPRVEAGGRVAFESDGLVSDGLLLTRPGLTIIPYLWQDVPEDVLPALLCDIRRVLAPMMRSTVVEGDLGVLPVHYRRDDHDAIMLVNLTRQQRSVVLRLSDAGMALSDLDGVPAGPQLRLEPDGVRVLLARAIPAAPRT